jgi:hypothetical protein
VGSHEFHWNLSQRLQELAIFADDSFDSQRLGVGSNHCISLATTTLLIEGDTFKRGGLPTQFD